MRVGLILALVVGVAGLHQPLTAVIFAVINVVSTRRPRWFLDFIREYMVWRSGVPKLSYSPTVKLANLIALVALVAVAIAVYQFGALGAGNWGNNERN